MREVYIIISILFLSIFMPMHQAEEAAFIEEGVSIVSLEATPSVLESGLDGTISIVVENKGGVEARNVTVEIVGGLDDWGITNRSAIVSKILLPPDPERGLERGEIASHDWTIIAPNVIERTTYEADIRLSYNYSTLSEGLIRVVSRSYSRQTGEIGGLKSFKVSEGPLSINVDTQTTIVIREERDEIPLTLSISNVGKGRVYLGNLTSPKLDKAILKASENLDCGEGYGKKREVRVTTQPTLISCKLNATDITTFKDIRFAINLTYNYFIIEKLFITAIPS